MNGFITSEKSSGQILLITLLVLTVGLTIALALIGQTRTNVSIGNEIEDSARAFAAAEAGIEEALRTGLSTSQAVQLSSQLANYQTSVAAIGTTVGPYTIPNVVKVGETATIWLVPHDVNGVPDASSRQYNDTQIRLCWKSNNVATIPGMAITLLYKRGNDYYTSRALADRSNAGNQFFIDPASPNGNDGCGDNAMYFTDVVFNSHLSPTVNIATVIPIALRLRPIYTDAFIAVQSTNALPRQGDVITSTGETNTGVSRRVVVSRLYRSPASIFDAAVVSQQNFAH